MSPSNDVDDAATSSCTFSLSRVGSKKPLPVHSRKRSLASLACSKKIRDRTNTNCPSMASGSSSSLQTKKRSRKDVKDILAKISADAQRKSAGAVPIPSFKPVLTTNLGRLEQAFFNDSDDDFDNVRTRDYTSKSLTKGPRSTDDPNKQEMHLHETGILESDDDDDILFSGTSPFHQCKERRQTSNGCSQRNDRVPMHVLGEDASPHRIDKQERPSEADVESTNRSSSCDAVNAAPPTNPPTSSDRRENRTTQLRNQTDKETTQDCQLIKPPTFTDLVEPHAIICSKVPSKSDCSTKASVLLALPEQKDNPTIPSFHTGPEPKQHSRLDPTCVEGTLPDVKLKAKRDRPRKQKQSVSRKTDTVTAPKCIENGQPEASVLTAIRPDVAPTKTRRYTRKHCCALCKTCPCQKVQNSDAITNVDLNALSRTGVAMERALIRRIQKLEKSSESLEEQTEMVRRKLKAHRRDTWRRAKEDLAVGKTGSKGGDSYFLPDPEDFEKQQMESVHINKSVVRKAQDRMFQDIPRK